jgi:aryl-alcohol dehydrogenase-like predicted oxidoreductase
MEERRLGRGGPAVGVLGLGTMVFGEDGGRGTPQLEAAAMIDAFLEAGGTHIDTANVYAGGRSEEIIGRALQGRRDQVILATKARFGSDPATAGLAPGAMRGALQGSLRRLDTGHVDLFYFHAWDPAVPIAESLGAAAGLVDEGLVRWLGVSNFAAWQMMKGLALSDALQAPRFVAAQYQYSLVVRDIEREFSDLCVAEGVGLVPWGPLGGGYLSGKYRPGDRPDRGRLATQPDRDEEAWGRRSTARNWAILREATRIAEAGGWTPSQVALAWLLGRPAVSSILLGVRTIDQLSDNLGALDVSLDDEARRALDAVSEPAEAYPYRFLEEYASG